MRNMRNYLLILTAFFFLNTASNAQAFSLKECMNNLPEQIEFTYVKDVLNKVPESFTDYENEVPGLGYGVTYRNTPCEVNIFIYNLKKDHITAADILEQQEISEKEMLDHLPENDEMIHQIFVTFIGENFFKIHTSCVMMYKGEDERLNEMVTRTVSAVAEENISAFMETCLITEAH